MRARLAGLVLGLALALALVTSASAHAILVSSDPPDGAVLAAAPTTVTLRFSESVQPFGAGVALLGPDGRPVAAGQARVEGVELVLPDVAATATGTYRVRWGVVADDTHPTRGELTFSVGAPSAAPAAEAEVGGVAPLGLALQTAGRWLHFLGYALGFGGTAFGVLVLRPLGLFDARDADGEGRTDAATAGSGAGGPGRAGDAGGPEASVSGTAAPGLGWTPDARADERAALDARRPAPADPPFALHPQPHAAVDAMADVIWRLANRGVLLLLVAEPLALLGQTASFDAAQTLDPAAVSAAMDSSFGRALGVRLGLALLLWVLVGVAQGGAVRAAPLALVVGWVLALADGGSAHAASLQPTWLGLLVNAVHLAAMGVWVGGLAALLWTRRGRAVSGDVVARFGRLALAALGALALSGLVMALVHLTGPGDLFRTPYGLALVGKVALVVVAVALARLGARRVELAGLAAVVLGAALLVSLPPPN